MNPTLELWLVAPVVAAVALATFADARSHQRRVAAVSLAHDAAFAGLSCADTLAHLTSAARAADLRLAGAAVTSSGVAPDQLLTVSIELAPDAGPFAAGPERRTATATVRRRDQATAACAERLGG